MQEGMKKTMRVAIDTHFGHLLDERHLYVDWREEYQIAADLLRLFSVVGGRVEPASF